MQINVSQLLKESIGSSRKYEMDEKIDIAENKHDRTVSGNISLLRTQRGILVRGGLRTELELTCSRCLSAFDYPLRINFEEEYIQTIDINSGLPLRPSDEPGLFIIDEHHVIDLREAVRQYAMLAVPMKPLCREDCAGICPEGGRNLNQGPCGCPVPTVDSRWSKLTNLR